MKACDGLTLCHVRCRRQFVAELLMSIHDSALADADLATTIEGVICSTCARAPAYAADLVQQAGKPSITQLARDTSAGTYLCSLSAQKTGSQACCCFSQAL